MGEEGSHTNRRACVCRQCCGAKLVMADGDRWSLSGGVCLSFV